MIGVLASLTICGALEYHLGIEKVGDILFSWTEKISLVFVGALIGEAVARPRDKGPS